ncbi:MAG: multidrug ABC transporter substrate-binding protein [Anaerolineales bacterium]|nr:MAG: multidrug ABC transporter substrate-binding protein [Anaerolineales bacterium]
MKISEVLRIAAEGISRNKLRALLTMLGVIIGVAAVIIMIAISAGTEATIAENIQSLGTNLLFVTQSMGGQMSMGPSRTSGSNSNFLIYDDAKAIESSISGISGVVVERDISETIKYGSNSVDSASVVGSTSSYPEVRDLTVASGRFLTDNDIEKAAKVAVLGYSTAQTLFGDADPVGEKITVGDIKLTVVGVMDKKGVVGNTNYDERVYIPLTLVFEKFTFSPFARVQGQQVGTVLVQVADLKTMDNVITQIQILLAKRHDTTVADLPFTVRTQEDIITTQESTTAAFRQLLAWVAAVSLVVGGIGIMNIMLVSVTERTREIGIRQATGATPGDVRGQFLTEALLLSLTGGLIGIIAGVGGAYIFEQIGGMRTVVVPSSILLAFASAAIVGIFFGFYPANKAAQLDPIEALRHE